MVFAGNGAWLCTGAQVPEGTDERVQRQYHGHKHVLTGLFVTQVTVRSMARLSRFKGAV